MAIRKQRSKWPNLFSFLNGCRGNKSEWKQSRTLDLCLALSLWQFLQSSALDQNASAGEKREAKSANCPYNMGYMSYYTKQPCCFIRHFQLTSVSLCISVIFALTCIQNKGCMCLVTHRWSLWCELIWKFFFLFFFPFFDLETDLRLN